jgi:hypothetical protein
LIEPQPVADVNAEHLQHGDPAVKDALDERAALLLILPGERWGCDTRVTLSSQTSTTIGMIIGRRRICS